MADRRFLPPPAHPARRPDGVHSGPPSFTTPRNLTPLSPATASPPRLPLRPSIGRSTALGGSSLSTNSSPALPERIPGSVENLFDPDSDDDESIALHTKDEEQLSTAELRELYDEEEIERFLQLFSAYVTEVELPRTSSGAKPSAPEHELVPDIDADDDEDSSWVGTQQDAPSSPSTISSPVVDDHDLGLGLAAWAASKILPLLPPPPPPQRPFSIKRARLAANRLFLALEPTYFPILKRMWYLAIWKDFGTSLFYYILFWIIWYNDLLLSGLFVRLLYALLRRKYLPYPSAAELRQYRREVELAESFSRSVILRVATSPAMNVADAWTAFKDYRTAKKEKKKAKADAEASASASTADLNAPVPEVVVDDTPATPVEESEVAEEELDTVPPIMEAEHVATPIMHAANGISDIHERIKNIFLWRRPNVSFGYALGLLLLALFTAFMPTKYLVKGLTMGLGVFFWHGIPVLAVLSPADRARIPPPLTHSPTDAEYAMELISQRVARGLPIKPRRKKKRTPFGSRVDVVDRASLMGLKTADDEDRGVDWDKWGGRVVHAKVWAGDVKQVFKGGNWKSLDKWAAAVNPLRPRDALQPRSSAPSVETYTFPAQRKGPGLITLTDTTLFYTPIASSTPELTIPLERILAVKKSGVARGLKVRFAEADARGGEEERTERFLWVGDRDSLFARLVGWHANH
ncbi:hypothetical protein PsYK624_022160 [Phanerochaete sordida]|uniref:GRAM domain-containing protein n=1 Tax=Phanerochaete sordida TaxID=48140 RepID=A0A9P3G0T8_9APHY|nr:hypothetical protein PsYK624_022160 [Phanerochaete sordida]